MLKDLRLDELRMLTRAVGLTHRVLKETGNGVNLATTDTLLKILNDYMKESGMDDGYFMEILSRKKEELKRKSLEVKQPKEQEMEPLEVETKAANEKTEMKFELGFDLGAILNSGVKSFIETTGPELIKKSIKNEIDEALKNIKPIHIHMPDRKEVVLTEKTHKTFPEVLLSCQIEKQAYLAGPAGSGKTTLAKQIAKALDTNFGFISCSAGMSEGHLLGRMLFDGTYISSRLVEIYENGGVFLFDEIDAADNNTLLVINSALANGYLSVPNRKENPVAMRHENFVCIVAANSFGKGSSHYVGRNVLDSAFLDRFSMSMHQVNYDNELEKEICKDSKEIYEFFKSVRKAIKEYDLKRVASTRAIVSAVRLAKANLSIEEIKERFLLSWTEEEKAKI